MQLRRTRRSHTATLDTFARRVARARLVWSISGSDGLGRVPSPTRREREVNLLWSAPEEADRWLTRFGTPRLNPLALRSLYDDVLPKLRELDRLVGPDWTVAEPVEIEVEPAEIERRLDAEYLQVFFEDAARAGAVWVLEDEMGPAFAASRGTPGELVLPCWSQRHGAETHCSGFWSEMMISRIACDRFVTRTLPWLIETGRGLAPDHGLGAPVEIGAREARDRLAEAGRAV